MEIWIATRDPWFQEGALFSSRDRETWFLPLPEKPGVLLMSWGQQSFPDLPAEQSGFAFTSSKAEGLAWVPKRVGPPPLTAKASGFQEAMYMGGLCPGPQRQLLTFVTPLLKGAPHGLQTCLGSCTNGLWVSECALPLCTDPSYSRQTCSPTLDL